IKPDVVLYEENLNEDVINGAINAISNCDTLIIAGTSLTVYPAAGFVGYFKGRHLVLINRDKTSYDKYAELVLREKVGEVLGEIVVE
ncbi:MAG: NAD-dependent protein deacylase, partial [Ruminiclostridium sp.]|nr:NAD-dependent protein deacylase [Ruminiclostridium sp.]